MTKQAGMARREVRAGMEAASTALVLVQPTGSRLREGDPSSLAAMERLLAAARRAQLLVLVLVRAGDEHDLAPQLQPLAAPNEQLVRTGGAGAFGASSIALLLRANGVRTLVLAGCDGRFDLTIVAQEAQARGYGCVLARDAVTGMPGAPEERGFADCLGAGELARRWNAVPPGDRGWQAGAKQRSWLRTLDARVEPAHTALVLIDVQNDFCALEGASGRRDGIPLVTAAAERIPRLLGAAREAGCLVVHVRAEYGTHVRGVGSPYRFPSGAAREGAVWSLSAAEAGGGEFAANEVEVCLPGSWGAQGLPGVAPAPGELVVTKHRFSCFIDTPLEAMLRARGIRTLVFAGVTTNCCIESSVRDASMLDFYVVVAEDCVGAKDTVRHLHQASLEQMATYFALLRPAAAIEASWQPARRLELAA